MKKNAETLPLMAESLYIWRIFQYLFWIIGFYLFLTLLFQPQRGVIFFWNLLIPLAPALFVLFPGLWRNICPLASTALFSRHMKWGLKKRLSTKWQGWLNLWSVLLLFLIIPLRHVTFNLNGHSTALLLGCTALVAVIGSFIFEWKSFWCAGLCPVHGVERFYGGEPLASLPNAHCDYCRNCVVSCPDSTPGIFPLINDQEKTRRIASALLVGGFPGFIWGWYQVPDYHNGAGWSHLGTVYFWPILGMLFTLALYQWIRFRHPGINEIRLIRIFAALAVSTYYWYRIPELFGFSPFPGDGLLIDLTEVLPFWFPYLSRGITTAFFFWWMVFHLKLDRSWMARPPFKKPKKEVVIQKLTGGKVVKMEPLPSKSDFSILASPLEKEFEELLQKSKKGSPKRKRKKG
ncbi:MAG: hypothetical protein D6785_11355 [Planctomycetota bacterium]|nr:MAG: hypothetical protein D6785_11355 [Planctomycetota bacterium]